MKKIRILGIIAAVLAAVVLAVGLYTDSAREGEGGFAATIESARVKQVAIEDAAKAVRNADSVVKKVDSASDKIASATTGVEEAAAAMAELAAAYESGALENADIAALDEALALIEGGAGLVEGEGLTDIEAGAEGIGEMSYRKLLELYAACADDAYSAVSGAESAIKGVYDGVIKVCDLSGAEYPEMTDVEMTEELPAFASIEECAQAVEALGARAQELGAYEPMLSQWAEQAVAIADEATLTRLTLSERLCVLLADNFIGIVFTAALLMVIAVVMIFFADAFRRQWTQNPVFSVFIALLVMLVFQTYALGFNHPGFGAWGKFWFDNTFNVLRANTSVGMVALGMTLVIITGGIDLAVGSTIAGVGTVLMTMIDTGSHGVLVKIGITGVPAFIIGIIVALMFGAAIGAVNGIVITKGRIPPFIMTLGVMSIVRSVAQYFTKSYTPTVPKEFEAIANFQIWGQRPMTIIYWVVLAVIFYLIMRNTAFGRYGYAVGSNERTTRLSGINTDRVKILVYMISGLMVAIAAVAQLSRLGGMDVASAGSGYEMDAIAAAVVGGTSMSGGKGSIVGTVLGVLIIGIMNNLLILLGVDSFLTEAFKGAIVVISVLMQRKEKLA